jgi:hypothetical protein
VTLDNTDVSAALRDILADLARVEVHSGDVYYINDQLSLAQYHLENALQEAKP